tara:strand:+ start:25679 stop:27037 length:1359 start_codon:yes stop_codon:yes gene_type:complete
VNKLIKLANGQGFWGDSIDAPANLVRGGEIHYLMLDYLAEVTMSIMQRLKKRNPDMGYATDFVNMIDQLLPELVKKNIKVLANAGGVNASACVDALKQVIQNHNLGEIKIGIVGGDDILSRVPDLLEKGHLFEHLDSGEPLGYRKNSLTAANVYIGAFPLADALSESAQIVITGRSTDPGLVLAPMIYEFGWGRKEYDLLASGTVAGHIVECGAQATGGNYSRWWEVEDFANIGYPIVEAENDGTFVITKHESTGGIVSKLSVSEQILYELGDPKNYISPDVVVDFTSFTLDEDGKDRVKVSKVSGEPPPDSYKVSMAYHAGFKASGELTISGPRAVEKAQLVSNIVWKRLNNSGCTFDEKRSELLGTGACHGEIAEIPEDLPEVVLRLSVRDDDREKVSRFGKEIAPVITTGPPGVTGFAGGRPKPQDVIAFWPTLIPKDEIEVSVKVVSV